MVRATKPNIRIIIQARTDSNRLPAKALLPVAGTPSAILAAKRAGNRGRPVMLATSDRPTDDLLATLANQAGINVFRGSANDVLGRFVASCQDLQGDDVVVRLTADNLLPDGMLIEELLASFELNGNPYINAKIAWGDSPYGLGAEVMNVCTLRRAALTASTEYEREHVTPEIKKHIPIHSLLQKFSQKESVTRCTMDTLDDYLRINRIFSKVQDPVNAGWQELLNYLVVADDAPRPISPGPCLVLGTAQLAAPYGSAVKVAPPKNEEAVELVRQAIHQGAIAIDTARAYAGSEVTLGKALSQGWGSRIQVVTKLSPLSHLPDDSVPNLAADAAELSVFKSLNALGGGVKPWILLHRAYHFHAWDGAVWKRMLELRSAGLLAGLGVSVQSTSELKKALSVSDVEIIQLPFNLLDWRWRESGLELMLSSRPDIQIHVRSVFLQSVLLRDAAEWPAVSGINAVELHNTLNVLVKELQRGSIADLCLAYVRSFNWVNGVVIGMESKPQLTKNIDLFTKPPLSQKEVAFVQDSLPLVPEKLLNPACWPKIQCSINDSTS